MKLAVAKSPRRLNDSERLNSFLQAPFLATNPDRLIDLQVSIEHAAEPYASMLEGGFAGPAV